MLSRRAFVGSAAAIVLAPGRAPARTSGFTIDWQGGSETPAIAASLAGQIALVEALAIDPAIAAFFAAQPIVVDLDLNTATRAGPRAIFFERRPLPADNPVLLHELLHRFHRLYLPDGLANADVRRFYDDVRASGRYPARAYMFKDPQEFFAMTASVVLHGRAARPPSLRSNVASKSPELFRWIVTVFGLRLN